MSDHPQQTQNTQLQGGGDATLPGGDPVNREEGVVQLLSCNTGQAGCSGKATFINNDNKTWSFTIWFQNGAGGRRNFVLESLQTEKQDVHAGDTYSCVPGNVLVPEQTPRNWIVVA